MSVQRPYYADRDGNIRRRNPSNSGAPFKVLTGPEVGDPAEIALMLNAAYELGWREQQHAIQAVLGIKP